LKYLRRRFQTISKQLRKTQIYKPNIFQNQQIMKTKGMRHIVAALALPILSGTAAFAQVPTDGYKLVWEDDFNGTELNRKYWNVEVNGDGGGNGELQYYSDRPQNVKVENGNLVLTAVRENYRGKSFTSGRINSNKKVVFGKGKIEARIKFPKTEKGLWPAFWMMGNDYNENGWPKCGETDIIEMGHKNGWVSPNQSDRYFNGALHWGPAWDVTANQEHTFNAPYSLQDGTYHTLTCVIDDEHINMYLDDTYNYFSFDLSTDRNNPDDWYNTYSVFTKDQFILFNLAVGGTLFPGISNAGEVSALPNANDQASMYVDYVRVYQKEGEENIRVNDTDTNGVPSTTASFDETVKKIEGELKSTFSNGVLVDGFIYGEHLQGVCLDKGYKLQDLRIDNTYTHWYNWNERGNAGAGTIAGVDGSTGAISHSAQDAGYHGAGFAIDFGKQANFSHFSDDSRLHISFSTKTKIPEAVKISILDNTGIGSYGAKLALGEGVDGNFLLTKSVEKGNWYTLDISFAELKQLYPSFNPANLAIWNGNVLTVEFPDRAVAPGDNVCIDAFYIYSPKPTDYVETEKVDPKAFTVADPKVGRTLDVFNDAIYDVFVMSEGARNQITAKNHILHDYRFGGGATRMDIWGDYGPTLKAGAGTITGVDGSSKDEYISMTNKMWPNWGAYALVYSVGGRYSFRHLTDESRLHISISTESSLTNIAPDTSNPNVALTFLSSPDAGFSPAKVFIGTPDADGLSVGDLPSAGNWTTLDISFADLKRLYPSFTYEQIANWFGQLLAVELNHGAIDNNVVVDAFYIYSPKPAGYEEEAGDDINKDGKFASAALDGNGNSTFAFETADKVVPLRMSDGALQKFAGKIRSGYDKNTVAPRFDLWENTYNVEEATGVNSFGINEGYTKLTVGTKGWNGGGINITNPTDFSFLASEPNYYLHIGIKDADADAHRNVTFKFNGQQISLGVTGNGFVTDFARDGEWHYLDIPVSELNNATFTGATAFNANLIEFNVEGKEGTPLEFDNVFLYEGPEYVAPDQPELPELGIEAVNPEAPGDLTGYVTVKGTASQKVDKQSASYPYTIHYRPTYNAEHNAVEIEAYLIWEKKMPKNVTDGTVTIDGKEYVMTKNENHVRYAISLDENLKQRVAPRAVNKQYFKVPVSFTIEYEGGKATTAPRDFEYGTKPGDAAVNPTVPETYNGMVSGKTAQTTQGETYEYDYKAYYVVDFNKEEKSLGVKTFIVWNDLMPVGFGSKYDGSSTDLGATVIGGVNYLNTLGEGNCFVANTKTSEIRGEGMRGEYNSESDFSTPIHLTVGYAEGTLTTSDYTYSYTAPAVEPDPEPEPGEEIEGYFGPYNYVMGTAPDQYVLDFYYKVEESADGKITFYAIEKWKDDKKPEGVAAQRVWVDGVSGPTYGNLENGVYVYKADKVFDKGATVTFRFQFSSSLGDSPEIKNGNDSFAYVMSGEGGGEDPKPDPDPEQPDDPTTDGNVTSGQVSGTFVSNETDHKDYPYTICLLYTSPSPRDS